MKKKIITKTTKTTKIKTKAIDIVQTEEHNESSALVNSSPLGFKDFNNENPINEYLKTNYKGEEGLYDPYAFQQSDTEDDVETHVFTGYTSDEDKDIEAKIAYQPSNQISRQDKINMVQKILPSAAVAIGTGLAMMPVFNHLVKKSGQFGIDIRSNEDEFITSTANTFIVASFSSFATMYHFIKKHQEDLVPEAKHVWVNVAKVGAACSVILPLGLLWGIELKNQEVVGSSGFDEYIAWATFTTAPLVINRVIESVKAVDSIRLNPANIELDSIGSKLAVYGLAALSIAGRTIAYTEAAKTLSLAVGISPEVSLGIGIVAGGVFGSGGDTVFEYQAVKSLFATRETPITFKNIVGGFVSTLEGAWFTLPIISLGLNATEGWSSLARGALYTPLFVSHSILESTRLYDNAAAMYDTISEGLKSLGCCESYTELNIS